MNDLYVAIQAWPTIVQGALGSALFALFLFFAEKFKKYSSKQYSKHSISSRMNWLNDEIARLRIMTTDGVDHAIAINVLLYRVMRPILKAFLWGMFGVVIDLMFSPAGYIAYFICIYYIMRAYYIVSPISHVDADERLAKHEAEYSELEEILKK